MNKFISKFAMFTAGAAIGSLAAFVITKNKYIAIAKEEFEDMSKYYEEKLEKFRNESSENTKDGLKVIVTKAEPDVYEYLQKVSDLGYTEEKGDPRAIGKPYVITPDEFDTIDYETVSLTYYADGVLADDMDDIVEDVDDIVGSDSLNHFGEYEDDGDIVFVRNDRMKVDYEICRDLRNYSDVTCSPHQV